MQSHDMPDSAESCFERGRLLQAQGRYADAALWFQKALSVDANHAISYAMLAFCWTHDELKAPQAVDAARRSVSLEPENAFYRSVLAITLLTTAKDGQNNVLREALETAKQATALDPDSDFAHMVEGQANLRLRKYPEAEASARHALSLNTENTDAAQVLSIALLQQRKDMDNESLVRYQLENNPDDDSSHTSAGWQALSTGNHRQANQHFLEALRLNPMNEGARLGLVESFRARSFLYRAYLAFGHFMNRFSEGSQTAIMIGGYIAYRVLKNVFDKSAPFLSTILVAVWLTFALWSHLARGMGSFFMLFDAYARRSLRPRELWEGIAVGGATLLALVILGISFAPGYTDSRYTALALFFSAIVSAAAFTNDHYIGKTVYNIAAVIAGLGALITFVDSVFQLHITAAQPAFLVTVLIGVAVSWLRPLRVGYA